MKSKSKSKINMNKTVIFIGFVTLIGLIGITGINAPNLTSTLGISAYASKKVIDIISTASNVWAVVGIVAAVVGGGGIGVGILATAKTLVKKFGKKYAAAW